MVTGLFTRRFGVEKCLFRWGEGGQNILLQLYRKGNIAAFWKQKNKSQIVCKGDKSTLRVSTFPQKQSITNGWKTSTTMDNR